MERNGSPSLPPVPSLPTPWASISVSPILNDTPEEQEAAKKAKYEDDKKAAENSSGGLFGAAIDKIIAFVKDSAMRVALVIIGILVIGLALNAMVQRSSK